MHETIEQILGYLRGIWRRRWLVLIVTWVVCVVGWVWIYLLQNEYQAYARVHVDTQSMLKPLLSGLAVQPNVDQQIAMMTRTLVSRPNLEKVARMTDLDLRAKDQKKLEELYNNELAKRISLTGTDRENLYTISYVHANQDMGKRVVQALLTIFTESSLGKTRRDLSSSQKFIEDQLKGYEAKLQEKQKELEAYKRKYAGILPAQGGPDFYARLNETNSALQQAKMDLEESLNRTRQLQQQLKDQEETLKAAPEQALPANTILDARISALQTQVDNLRLRFTDMHPEIQRTRQLIASLQEQKRKEAEAAATGVDGKPASTMQNPVYQQISIASAEAEANVASLKSRVAQLEKRRAELVQAIDRIPQIEGEYALIMRDYDIYKSNFTELLQRRETAVFTGEVESKTDVVDFRVIDPPRVANQPAWPNRPMLISLTPLGGLSAGVVLAFLLAQLRPTVENRRQLSELTGYPLLGTVSRFNSEHNLRRKRRHNLVFAGGVVSLLVAYGGLMVYYMLLSAAA